MIRLPNWRALFIVTIFISTPLFAQDTGSDYILVKDGVDRQSFIRITNSDGRRLSADYYLVSGTAIENQDFRLDQTGPIELEAGQFADIPVTAIAEALPHFNRHETFEILSRDAAYRFWSPGDQVEDHLLEYSSLSGLGYWVDHTFDAGFGFQAIGLTSHEYFTMHVTWRDARGNVISTQERRIWIFDLDRPPILAIRGTEPSSIQDWLSNAGPEGIGYSQFVANQGAVTDWLAKVSDPRQGDFRFRPHVTGHSLGGAVTQWVASSYTWNGGLLGEIVTFNSPGIANKTASGDGVSRFRSDRANAVTHYITGGDIVSLFGERYLPGSSVQSSSTPTWAHTIYTVGPDSVFNVDHKDYKHSVPVLTDFIVKNGKRLDRPNERFDRHFDNQILNDPFFSYVSREHRDADYFGFLQMVARSPALQPAIGPALAAVLNYRFSVEAARAEVARLLYSLPVLQPTQTVLRAWRAAQVWKAQAWHFIGVMTRNVLGTSNRLDKGGVSAEPANFWEASARWPEAAWEASETWQDHAWEAMASWRPEQWAATIPVDFPWAETPQWSRSDWENVKPVQTKSFIGTVFQDLDGDGMRDPGEPGLAGETIFIDRDGVGFLDENDLQTGSSGDGQFALVTSTLSAGSYPLRIVLPGDNWVVTAPPSGTHILVLDNDPGQRIEGLDFGIRCMTECRVIPDERPGEETIAISDDAFLRTYTDVKRESLVDTGIRTSDFACGVMGFAASGGDISEYNGGWSRPDGTRQRLIEVSLRSHSGRWHLVGGFRTNRNKENWDRISILCLSTAVASSNRPLAGKPIFRQQFTKLGDNIDYDTGISASRYACGIAGFGAFGGDINEKGRGTIQKTYLDGTSGNWRLLADFRTHDDHETWNADVLCFDREIASVDGPLPGKPYFIKSYKRLGDNIDFDTGIAFDQWVCGVTGFQIRSGDLDERGKAKGTNLIQAYAHAKNGRWHLRADFRTHRDHEDWDVDILCAARGGLPPDLKRNVSRKERGLQVCMGENMSCQVMVDELISVTGFVRVLGGGFEGSPSGTGSRCADKSAVGVYVNDRNARGLPQWSEPDFCVSNNSTFQLSPYNTYDLRSTSVVGVEPAPFELIPANALVMTGAMAKDFPAPYGPGIALTWKPSSDARLRFYEIQYSFDELNWEIYTDSRDAVHGGWINHHGNIAYQNIDKALPPGWTYFYRVRALDVTGNAFTPWSNVVAGTVRNWNQRPTIDAIGYQQVRVHDWIQFDVVASDPEGMADVQIEATQLPPGAIFAPVRGAGRVSGSFTWVINDSDVGVNVATFAAKDALGATATKTVVIFVQGHRCDYGRLDCLDLP